MGKSSLRRIAQNHFSTLYDNHNTEKKMRLKDVFFQIGIPLLFGVIIWFLGWVPTAQIVSNAIMGLSIVSALMCTMAALVFQVRIDVRRNEGPSDRKADLLDELFFNILWTIIVGFSLVLILLVFDALGWFDAEALDKICSALISGVALHFVLIIGMCLKRLCRSYELLGMGKMFN